MKPFTVSSATGKLTVTSVKYHRNGVGGNGFSVVQFTSRLYGRMVATVFDEPGNIAVLSLDNLEERWRGDEFEQGIREAIGRLDAEYQATRNIEGSPYV